MPDIVQSKLSIGDIEDTRKTFISEWNPIYAQKETITVYSQMS